MLSLLHSLWVAALLLGLTLGQYFPPNPEGITVVNSRFGENITISYKEVSEDLHLYDNH
jgi:hypothetical protein